MILLKIGVTLIFIALLYIMWSVVVDLIIETIYKHKYHFLYWKDNIFWIIFCTLIASGATICIICFIIGIYMGGK